MNLVFNVNEPGMQFLKDVTPSTIIEECERRVSIRKEMLADDILDEMRKDKPSGFLIKYSAERGFDRIHKLNQIIKANM